MTRQWRRGSDVRGQHDYLQISPDVRLVRRPNQSAGYGYEVHQWDDLTGQYVPVYPDGPMHSSNLAIATAKHFARACGQTPIGVR